MKLLYLSSFKIPHVGGLSSRFLDELEYFSKKGYVVSSLTCAPDAGAATAAPCEAGAIRRHFYPVRGSSLMGKILRLPTFLGPFYTAKIFLLDRKERFDSIMAHDVYTALFSVLAGCGSRTVLTMHSICSQDYLVMGRKGNPLWSLAFRLRSIADGFVEHFVYRAIPAIICVSEYEADDVLRKTGGRKKPAIIRNWVDVSRFGKITGEGARARLGFSRDGTLGIFIGRMVPKNGPQLIVPAALEAMKSVPGLEFCMVGDGPELERCRKMAEGNAKMRFLGPRSDVPELLAASDFFVSHVSGLVDGVGFTVLEAMAAGKPVICGRDRITEKLFGSRDALLVRKDSVPELAGAIASLTRDRKAMTAMGTAARARAEADFSREAALNNVERVLTQVIRSAD